MFNSFACVRINKTSETISLNQNEENEVKMSKDDEVSTPNSERCGKKTMFPMVFAYEEAKSPRSPLGQLNLNTKFMVCNLI